GPGNKGAILAAAERTTGFLWMKKLPRGKNAKALAKELFFLLVPYKQDVHSITSDNGTEFYEHKMIAKKRNAMFFFAHPYSSWERGLNEYTNGLVRKYIPKKELFTKYKEDDLTNFQHKINRRPRKVLDFESLEERFFRKVAFAT
ncbi:MAG: IS30 family transposase, partial [Odoribacteraceae bacterium]|nr:IS30 family transposase [Odoribacteraceae bacterium]